VQTPDRHRAFWSAQTSARSQAPFKATGFTKTRVQHNVTNTVSPSEVLGLYSQHKITHSPAQCQKCYNHYTIDSGCSDQHRYLSAAYSFNVTGLTTDISGVISNFGPPCNKIIQGPPLFSLPSPQTPSPPALTDHVLFPFFLSLLSPTFSCLTSRPF